MEPSSTTRSIAASHKFSCDVTLYGPDATCNCGLPEELEPINLGAIVQAVLAEHDASGDPPYRADAL